MYYAQIKYLFFIFITITFMLCIINEFIQYKLQKIISTLNNYIEDESIFDIPIIKVSYNEFTDTTVIKNYITQYNVFLEKKEDNSLSKFETRALKQLENDIIFLKVSFLSSILEDNKEIFSDVFVLHLNNFLSYIKLIQILKILKLFFVLISVIYFIKLI